MEDETRPRGRDEQADFVMSFVEHSSEARQDMEEIWDEIEQNFLVRPLAECRSGRNTNDPLDQSRHNTSGYAVLKDPETHQSVMTIVSNIILSTMPEPGYVHAVRQGMEDVLKAKPVNALLEYSDRLPGAYSANVEWVMSAGIYGTGIKEIFWDYQEGPRSFRKIDVDPFTGEQTSEFETLVGPTYDDVREEVFDPRDFFNDPGENRMDRMLGAVRRFKITAAKARSLAEAEVYETKGVEAAIERRATKDAKEDEDKPGYDETDLSTVRESHDDFINMTGYKYIGTVPWKSPDGMQRREIVVIGGETVRSKPWTRRLPWFDVRLTPRLNSFWGISPGEIMRYDQDFADAMKMMLADASARLVHPPPIYDKNAGIDQAKLRAWRPRVPIGVEGDPNRAVATPNYNPNLQYGFAVYSGAKQQMREGGGATDTEQGLGIGTKRLSASEAVGTMERSGKRPELFAQVVERESLPPCGQYKLRLYGEFLEDDEDLRLRIGESNATARLADILPEYDIQYIGTRLAGTKADQINVMRELFAVGANPAVTPMIPWIPLIKMILDKQGAHEVAAMVGNPQMAQFYLMMMQLGSPGGQNAQNGNGNGTTPSNPPPGLMPAQTLGATVGQA